MVHVEYFTCLQSKSVIEIIRQVHERHKDLSYLEMLDKKPQSKYDYYLDMVVIGGVTIYAGKYANYDKVTGTFDMLPMLAIRINPNKYFESEWFQEIVKELIVKNATSGMLRKYDYAIDIPKELKCVEVLNSRKEAGLYKGTRYYGQAGRHGYLKIYDKQKDMKRQKVDIGTMTRVEHTLMGSAGPSLENVCVLSNDVAELDYSKLKDTERAIVEMYLQLKALGSNYELKLGRVMKNKLMPYISGRYEPLEYGDILERLLENIKKVFKLQEGFQQMPVEQDADGFMKVSEEDVEALEELFGG